MNSKVLIIGGGGFIGSHLVDTCLKQGCQVSVYDDFSTGRREYLPQDAALQVIESSLLDSTSLAEAVAGFDPQVLFHLAAIHYIPACEKAPEEALRINVEGTQRVLTACAQFGIPRIVFASTGALYDPLINGGLSETSPVKAHDIYGITKVTCEKLIEYHVFKNGGEAVVARLFNTVGPRETNPHIIPTIIAQLASGSRQVKIGNLHPRRDYVHVKDVADALFALAYAPIQQPVDLFNIGSGREFSVQDLLELCAEVIADPLEIISEPTLQRKTDRPSQLADVSKILQVTGWMPSRTLKQALSEAWDEALQKLRTN